MWERHGARLRRVPIIAGIILAAILLRSLATTAPTPPALATSCTTPAFALSSYDVEQRTSVQWSMTGPAGAGFVLVVVPRGETPAIPQTATPGRDRQFAAASTQMSSRCTAHGSFRPVVDPGRYTVAMLPASGSGDTAVTHPLTVTAES